MTKKNLLSAALAAALGVGISGAAHAAAVTGIVVQDVNADGISGRFGFNALQTSNWTGDVGTGTLLGQGAANPTGSFSTGFNFAGQPFVPYTYGAGLNADITGGVLTVSSLDFGGNFAGVANFNLPPDAPVTVNFVNATANPNEFDVQFTWSHYITPTDDPSGSYVGFTARWTVEGTATVVPVPAAAWLLGSGLLGLAGVARRRSTVKS